MNAHALRVLELDAALERVAKRASSTLGRERVRTLRPGTEPERIASELSAVDQTAVFLGDRPNWAPAELPDAREALQFLGVDGSVLDPHQLYRIGTLLESGRLLRADLHEVHETAPGLWSRCSGLHDDRSREAAIARVVDGSGQVLDTASKELKRIRSDLSRAHSRVVRQLEEYLGTLPDRFVVADGSVTIRNGRYVVPLRREGRREVGGIIHDQSATGATLFVEPPLAIQLMNDLKELERDEAREVHRILREQTMELRPSLDALEASQEAAIVFDSLYARARTSLDWEGTAPELLPAGQRGLRIVRGRHPLLLSGSGKSVVPFHLEMEADEHVMVVSGPNTGGKTVFLKAVGLVSALTQCGVVPPVGAGTRLPVFTGFFADIGDEQSIAKSLSTFAAHLANLREVVEGADASSLVLIDEMGTGTDPAEGAALARALLEELVERQALAVVTSHLGALKRLDTAGSGIVNASLEFDPDRMEPTYVLIKGRPGRSYGLSIARRLGFPGTVLDRAETHLSEGDARLDDLLERLQRTEREGRALSESLTAEKEVTARMAAELAGREEALAEREQSSDRRARDDARRLLLEARAEVEAAIREVREAAAEGGSEVDRAARRRIEDAAERHRLAREAEPHTVRSGPVSVGDRVRIRSSGTKGQVLELRAERAVVSTSGLKLQVHVSELALLSDTAAAPGRPARTGGAWTAPEVREGTEVDLRGLRVDEVQLELERGLDGAVLGDFGELRIIHGKGTGAVRQRVQQLLEREARVTGFRLGGPGEGGAGVTVATLR